jgi:methionyl-tRNA formyltransferase
MRVVFVTHNDLGLACLEELVDLNAPEERERLAGYEPELLFVVGWSRLVGPEVIETASVATLGMHPAPLPRGRGRAPIAWSLVKGLDETALSFFHLVEEADAGDLVGQESIPIAPTDDAASLYEKVVAAGRTLVRDNYPRFAAGEVPRTPQNDDEATWWPKRVPDHGLVDWNDPPERVHDWIRGQSRPYPGAFSYLPTFGETKVVFWGSAPPTGERAFGRPGEIAARDGDRLRVYCFEGVVELTEVQVGDDDPIPAGELLERYDVTVGDRFENARDRLVD